MSDFCAPLAGTSVRILSEALRKDCSEHGSGLLATDRSCNCQMPNRYFRGTSTVLKSTCEGTWLVNIDGCLQCKASRISDTSGYVCMATPLSE